MFESLDSIVGEVAMVVVINGDLAGNEQDVSLGIGLGHIICLTHCNGMKKVGRVGPINVTAVGV